MCECQWQQENSHQQGRPQQRGTCNCMVACNSRDACNSRVCLQRQGSQQQHGKKQQQAMPTSARKFTLRGSTATKMQLHQKRCKQGWKQQKGCQQMKGCLQHQKLQQQVEMSVIAGMPALLRKSKISSNNRDPLNSIDTSNSRDDSKSIDSINSRDTLSLAGIQVKAKASATPGA